MNKQEVIDLIKKEARHHCGEDECYRQGCGKFVELDKAVDFVSRIGEQSKVVIPKFVAEKIEYCKANSGYSLFHAMDYCFQFKDSADWLECNQDLFARAWLDGYTIEQEKLYQVVLPGTKNYYDRPQKLCQGEAGNHFFCGEASRYKHNFTEAEIRNEFAWAWDAGFAKEVE